MTPTSSATTQAMDAFVAELARWRAERGLSKKRLAAEMGFDPSYVSHIESKRHRPTEDFARRAEAVLHAGGALWRSWQEYEVTRQAHVPGRDPPVPEQRFPFGTGLVVEREQAELSYVDGMYRASVRRVLYNAGVDPITRYLVRISVDRYPTDPDRSNRYYRDHPLTWDELQLEARYAGGEPMNWQIKHDRDSFKEVWLVFENARGRFPLYPGQRAEISYAWQAGDDKWGQWFQRAVRVPTRRLGVRVVLPAGLEPTVWGLETTLTSEAAPLHTPLTISERSDGVVYDWVTEDPPLNARYRLEWRFNAGSDSAEVEPGPSVPVGQRMRAAGIVQRGSQILARPARQFHLPHEADLAADIVDRLFATMHRVSDLHVFGKGIGLAAPQIGVGVAAAVVQPAGGDAGPIVLLNPEIVGESEQTDSQHEGCLSFFDFRGVVPRPLHLEVAHLTLAGDPVITTFERGMARLVGHEVDHLHGLLYTDRLPPGSALIPVSEYGDTGRPWRY